MSRPQIGIDRLPARRMTSEPRESMNCKSCRKRKIKCNRLRPTCEACQVFACPCIYDAVPKKRGPKTDVLEALLKRVDVLEKRLHTEKKSDSSPDHDSTSQDTGSDSNNNGALPPRPLVELAPHPNHTPALISPTEPSLQASTVVPDVLLDIYFTRIHNKPYNILDEATTRQRMQLGLVPPYLAYAIYAVSARHTPQFGGYNGAVRISQEYGRRSRTELDIDEPSIEALQTLLLLAQASYQAGRGKKAYMLLTSGVSMAFALDLHRELPLAMKITPAEREGRRRLFWSCYLLDRFSACGSKRPSLIADEAIVLRLPSWQLHPGAMLIEGDYFPNGSNLQYMGGSGKQGQGSMGMLIGIVKILGITNRYLAAGGVKGDSHFPWHSLSNLSKVRQELDIWASETQDTFTSIEALFGQPDSTIYVLSKLIYHLIHCLIYRPFLPVDLAELSGTSQHQSWQIEATNLCFLHANAIAELVEIGRASSIIDWPAFVGYCVCTAGTIHVHGAHYRGREGEVFSSSSEFLSREMHQLSELRFIWAGVQHQRETLQTIYGCHTELVKSLASNPMRFSPVFQLEDFFDRYAGQAFDGAHLTFSDIQVESVHESLSSYNIENRNTLYNGPNLINLQTMPQTTFSISHQPTTQPPVPSENRKKRRSTANGPRPVLQSSKSATHDPTSESPQFPTITATTPLTALAKPAQDLSHFTLFTPPAPFSPSSFNFGALDPSLPSNDSATHQTGANGGSFDPMFSMPTPTPFEQQPTPGAASASGSAHTDPEKDPFLSLLEQLAENEVSRGGPSELDFFLSGGL
ncbi:uncharacterized protein BDZ99DRAFT_26366 [Mytilinidion resinicola]|uniref:Zn(2)-C6 fungal-type domain-containing protein n=1 Tax=Mytilinidion resinicola TaxID=574789 RepID=A0A6A6YL64_9PEZI|nr:uncharacterized protein BDZ99DRAFT_26366 [Mytilinidion resinicola]KAF2809303.1 hypothetical protein BDZ99DRAFT_26366 [Mytilinidion resinicola]